MGTAPETTQRAGWSPFAQPLERHCEAVADALLKVVEGGKYALEELDATTYTDFRRRHPHLGLPRATTVAGACGGWEAAVSYAALKAAALHREGVARREAA